MKKSLPDLEFSWQSECPYRYKGPKKMFKYNGPQPFTTLVGGVISEIIQIGKIVVCLLVTICSLGFFSCTWE